MDLLKLLKTQNKKLHTLLNSGLKFCLVLSLIATLILTLYRSTYILFQYYLGITVLRISIAFFVSFVICYLAFIRITDDIE